MVRQSCKTKWTTKFSEKQRSPPGLRPAGTKVGDGSSPCSLSRAGIWRPKGCRLPDAILHGKRNCGLIAGPSSPLRLAEFRVRPLSSLGLAFAAPAYEPGKDTFVTCISASLPVTLGRPPLLAVRWPSVTGLTSYLSGCIWLTSQRCVFYIAGVLEGLRALATTLFFPAHMLTLSRLSASFIWRIG